MCNLICIYIYIYRCVDPLRSYLFDTLPEYSHAEVPELASYILTLLKRDQSTPELKDICVEQLQDFFHSDPTPFIEALFLHLTEHMDHWTSVGPAEASLEELIAQPDSEEGGDVSTGSGDENDETSLASPTVSS